VPGCGYPDRKPHSAAVTPVRICPGVRETPAARRRAVPILKTGRLRGFARLDFASPGRFGRQIAVRTGDCSASDSRFSRNYYNFRSKFEKTTTTFDKNHNW
jgi:hypothetical protein